MAWAKGGRTLGGPTDNAGPFQSEFKNFSSSGPAHGFSALPAVRQAHAIPGRYACSGAPSIR
jgi:hypothetical protein